MKRIALSLLLLVCAGCNTLKETPEIIEAHKGEGIPFQYKNLPDHEALEVSFTVHFLGPWDGTGYAQWSPDRFFCKLDTTTLLDSTFNNCHLTFVDNIWQSFPDPYHKDQLDFKNTRKSSIDGTYLYHGGHGAELVASLGFKWSTKPSVDSTYKLAFIIPHDGDVATLQFGTIWKEESENTTTYKLENLKIKPLKKLPTLNSKEEEKAWLSFFSGSPDASQKAWQEIYVTHPDRLIERAEALINGDEKRKVYLLDQIAKGSIPTESLYQEVSIDPNARDLKQQVHRILCLRELAFGNFLSSKDRQDAWNAVDLSEKMKSLRKVCSIGGCSPNRDCTPLEKVRMRLSSYLRMINTEESLRLAKELDQ